MPYPPVFCVRLAAGLVGALLLLSAAQVNPRFYRTQFLIVLGLVVVGLLFCWEGGLGLVVCLSVAAVLAFLGSLSWSLEKSPGGSVLIALTLTALLAALYFAESHEPESIPLAVRLINGLTSAALLGSATAAMLMGHSYLIAPSMAITPLVRLTWALLGCTLLRAAVAGTGLWFWTQRHSLVNLEDDTVLWLPVRWGLGFLAPLVLGWMAWQTARLRSTQSATGILYVAVIFCFLGELTGQLLLGNTGLPL